MSTIFSLIYNMPNNLENENFFNLNFFVFFRLLILSPDGESGLYRMLNNAIRQKNPVRAPHALTGARSDGYIEGGLPMHNNSA